MIKASPPWCQITAPAVHRLRQGWQGRRGHTAQRCGRTACRRPAPPSPRSSIGRRQGLWGRGRRFARREQSGGNNGRRFGGALCMPTPAALALPVPMGGIPRSHARRRLGTLLGVCRAPAVGLAGSAAGACGTAFVRAVSGPANPCGKRLAALLASCACGPADRPVGLGRASLAVGGAGFGVLPKAAPAQPACGRPWRRAAWRASGAASSLMALLWFPRPSPLLPLRIPADGVRRPRARRGDGSIPGVGHSPPSVISAAPPLVLNAARVRAVSGQAGFCGKRPAALSAVHAQHPADGPVGLGRARLAVGGAGASVRRKASPAHPACGLALHRTAH